MCHLGSSHCEELNTCLKASHLVYVCACVRWRNRNTKLPRPDLRSCAIKNVAKLMQSKALRRHITLCGHRIMLRHGNLSFLLRSSVFERSSYRHPVLSCRDQPTSIRTTPDVGPPYVGYVIKQLGSSVLRVFTPSLLEVMSPSCCGCFIFGTCWTGGVSVVGVGVAPFRTGTPVVHLLLCRLS